MARLITLLLFCLASLAYSNATAATTPPVAIPMVEQPTDDGSDDRIDYRRRTPPRPVMLTVDFDTKSMTLTNGIDPAEITAYEIRDTVGQTLYVFSDETAFVTTLSTLPPEEYQILLSINGSLWSGYFSIY